MGRRHIMRRPKPVCLLCRIQAVSPTSKARVIQWQTQVANVSTTGASSQGVRSGESPPFLRKTIDRTAQRQRPDALRSQTRAAAGEESSSRSEALFQQIVREQNVLQDTAGERLTPDNRSVNLPLIRAIGQLREMVSGNAPVTQAYSMFQTQIKPAVSESDVYVRTAYQKVVVALLEKLVAAKKADMFAEDLPTVAEITRLYVEVDELQPKEWAMLVRQLLLCIVDTNPATKAKRIVSQKAMLADLIESWKIFSLPRDAVPTKKESELTSNLWFPTFDKIWEQKFAKTGDFTDAFSTLFPQYAPTQLGSPVATLAIATIVLLHDGSLCPIQTRDEAARFISTVASLVTIVEYQDAHLKKEIDEALPGLGKYVMGLWPSIKTVLAEKHAIRLKSSPEASSPGRSAGPFNPKHIGERLGLISTNRNAGELDRLWETFLGSEDPMSKERIELIRQNPMLIDSFVREHIAFSQPHKAMQAWDLIGKLRLRPTIRSWNQMLNGLRRRRNLVGINNVWAKLLASGLPLDVHVWTTRVGGLIESGDIEGGILALREMISLWEKRPETAVRPSIEPVNAAVAALTNMGRPKAAEQVLAWARTKGIQQDAYTFNMKLRSLVRNGGASEEIEKLLSTMEEQGVIANEATFTILLDTAFSNDASQNPDEQARFVSSVASAMRESGMQFNKKTYAKMIYVLLRSNATAAAMDVVNHMYERKMELTPHIYTILIEHFFEKDPPDLESVRLIMKRQHHFGSTKKMDAVFYDRLVGGFTAAGDAESALEVVEFVIKSGSLITLPVLVDLLQVALHKGLREEAAKMVMLEKERAEIHNENREEHAGYWNHRFWYLALENKLLGY